VRYQFIHKLIQEQHQGRFSLGALCRVMSVSRAGYHAWRNRQPSRREREETELLARIKAAHEQSRGTYGSPRIHQELKANGVACGRHRTARIMRKHGITARPKRRFVVTTDSRHNLPVAENLLGQQFGSEKPNARWVADITYVWTGEGWLYLAVILDLWSRRVVGWAMDKSLDRSLVIAALNAALRLRHPTEALICHSDRGCQYASSDYQERLSAAGIVCSMSRKGNCYDNAPVESFFASLKRELVNRCAFQTRDQARQAIFWWIEVWYNRKRRHSALGYLSPEQFERQHLIQRAA
jgi:putative transposase